MTDPDLLRRADLVVGLDYGQFYLHTADNDPDLAIALVEQAQDAGGIAQAGGLLVVESPHQNNFEMPLRVEVWTAEPPADLDDWQEAFEAHLDIDEFGMAYESPTCDLVPLEVPSGSYHVLITGRGFVQDGWPGSTEPGDEWRIRLRSSATPFPAQRLRRWTPPADTSADSVHAARAARRRAKQRPKRVFDMTDPVRRSLIEQTERFTPPPANDYRHVRVDRNAGILDAETIFQVVPSQLMLILAGPDIDSLDPHGYLRRARKSIDGILRQIPEDRAAPLRRLDALIEDALTFDAMDRARTRTPDS